MPDATPHPGQRLRALMNDHTVVLPGAYNGFVARAVAAAGFEGTYVSGAAVSAAAGLPDIGLLTLEHFCRVIHEVAVSSNLPLIADADTGFGEAEMLVRAVHEYSRAGAAGCHIEDQVFPKRCGHLDGKTLVSVDHMVEKVSRAAGARDACSGGAFIVCARTDAAGVDGFDAAVERATAYVKAGADMIFPEALKGEDDFARFAKAMRSLKGPDPRGGPYLLANMTEFGKSPLLPHAKLSELGYACIIHPVSTLRAASAAVGELLASIRKTGNVEAFVPRMQPRADLYALLGYTPGTEWTYPSPAPPRGKP